jgi:hypothetical protein
MHQKNSEEGECVNIPVAVGMVVHRAEEDAMNKVSV